jgi:uncharacterized NAD(P)/FAD-binding protein YdhS
VDTKKDKHTAPRIAIIGGGFSGAMALVNLVNLARMPLDIDWFEPREMPGRGIAYRTKDHNHLLNVQAARMGAFPDRPDDFFQWLKTRDGQKSAAAIYPNTIKPDSYLPRALYGVYLEGVVKAAREKAISKNITINLHAKTITALDFQNYDAIVLATGNLPPRDFKFSTAIPDGWNYNFSTLPEKSGVVIIGTGLTMIDTVITLKHRGYEGAITAISRNGLMPVIHNHAQAYPAWGWVQSPQTAPRSALGLLRGLKAEVRKAQIKGYDWRAVIDSLRPVTQIIWQNLDETEKKKFMRRLSSFWNIHRHRVAPEIADQIAQMQKQNRLKIIAGTLTDINTVQSAYNVVYRARRKRDAQSLKAGLVLNCTGPDYSVKSAPLLAGLTPGPLGMGLAINADGSAANTAPGRIYPMGALLVGELLECTAVPELRAQARDIALNLLQNLDFMYAGAH